MGCARRAQEPGYVQELMASAGLGCECHHIMLVGDSLPGEGRSQLLSHLHPCFASALLSAGLDPQPVLACTVLLLGVCLFSHCSALVI